MYLSEAATLARTLMNANGLGAVRFEFDRGKNRFGSCQYDRLTGAAAKITLSEHLVRLNDEARVTQTILHEIAHALAGSKAGHGPLWQHHARKIGLANPQRCFSEKNTVVVQGKVTMTCVKCCKVVGTRHKMPKAGLTYTHRGCGGKVSGLRPAF